jgi:hypothetical protein
MKILACISSFGWATLFVAQGVFLCLALFSGYDADLVWHMSGYLLVSTFKVFFFGGVGLVLSVAVFRTVGRRDSSSRWLLWALAVLSLLALWSFCLAGLALYWHPPLGDGTLAGALASYGRLHYSGSAGGVAWRLWQQLFLVGSCVLWLGLSLRPPDYSRQSSTVVPA